jgi:hypothetical protein
MERTLICTTEDKKKMYKAINNGSLQLKDFPGLEINVTDIIQVDSVRKETGEEAVNTVLISDTGECYATLSPTVDDSVHNMVEIFGFPSQDNPIAVEVKTGKSNAGREYFYLDVV